MRYYTKLFHSILTSSIWCEDHEIVRVWITILAMTNSDGEITVTIPGLSHMSRVRQEKVIEAIEKFTAPDPYSSSQEFEGRRLEKIEAGWRVLNHSKFRDMASRDHRREYLRKKQREYRQKHKEAVGAQMYNRELDARRKADDKISNQIRGEKTL